MTPKHGKQKKKAAKDQQGDSKNKSNPASSSSSLPSNPFDIITSGGRVTKTHIYFHGGILSNWWLNSSNFSGARCFELLLPVLGKEQIPHPSPEALSSRLMSDHMFNCGEQWMMAMKGWIFERNIELTERRVNVDEEESTEAFMGRKEYHDLRNHLLAKEIKEEWKPYKPGEGNVLTKEGEMYKSTICEVLRSKVPGDQKVRGRNCANFDNDDWKAPSIASTVAACIARAEIDVHLRRLYLASATKKFVEGSLSDKVWGVGLRWQDPQIENDALWRGENRLGRCHDEAARRFRDMVEEDELESGLF